MTFIRKIFPVVAIVITGFLTLQAQLPGTDLGELAVVNDSVVDEGYRLYLYEKLSWVVTDAYAEQCTSKTANFMIVGELGDSLLSGVMVDTRRAQCVFEARINLNSGDFQFLNLVRGLSPKEVERVQRKNDLLSIVYSLPDIVSYDESGNLNTEVVEMPGDITRVYILQGTTRSKLIPFGNDYSIDFDSDNRIVARRKYHNSFIPIDFSRVDGNISKCTHSHTPGNPYVTPTDVCTFLLYGHDLYGMKSFSVYSTALACYFAYIADEHKIITITDEETITK